VCRDEFDDNSDDLDRHWDFQNGRSDHILCSRWRENAICCHRAAPVWLSLAIMKWAGPVTDAIDGTSMDVDYVRVYRAAEVSLPKTFKPTKTRAALTPPAHHRGSR